MEKVRLTQEQMKALEWVISGRSKESIVKEKASRLKTRGSYMLDENNIVFNDMAFETLVKALYIGYEVEEAFEVGDWVWYSAYYEDERIGRVTEIGEDYIKYDIGYSNK